MEALSSIKIDPIAGFSPDEWNTTPPTERVARLKTRLLENQRLVDVERARYASDSYRQTEGEPMVIRRAIEGKAFSLNQTDHAQGHILPDVESWLRLGVKGCDIVNAIHAELYPSPFLSLVISDCLERGLDVTAGGAHYNFSGVQALKKFAIFLRGFCTLKIPHVQFNVVSAETLRQAQQNPEAYRLLVVRVAGYSAYFTELDEALQDEIIRRTGFSAT